MLAKPMVGRKVSDFHGLYLRKCAFRDLIGRDSISPRWETHEKHHIEEQTCSKASPQDVELRKLELCWH